MLFVWFLSVVEAYFLVDQFHSITFQNSNNLAVWKSEVHFEFQNPKIQTLKFRVWT